MAWLYQAEAAGGLLEAARVCSAGLIPAWQTWRCIAPILLQGKACWLAVGSGMSRRPIAVGFFCVCLSCGEQLRLSLLQALRREDDESPASHLHPTQATSDGLHLLELPAGLAKACWALLSIEVPLFPLPDPALSSTLYRR